MLLRHYYERLAIRVHFRGGEILQVCPILVKMRVVIENSMLPLVSRAPATRLLALVLVPAVLLVAIAVDGADGVVDDHGGRPQIVASTGVATAIVAGVAGARADVSQLVPSGSSPHSYAPSAHERAELEAADLVVYFSPALEQGLQLDRVDRSFAFADHAARMRSFEADELESGTDPHLWMDPTQIVTALGALADELAEIDPAGAAGYHRRAELYGARLRRLDRRLRRIVSRIPPENRKLVTSHDSLGYFADRYGFEFLGAPFGAVPEAAASAGELGDLIERVADSEALASERIPAVFAQEGDDPEVLRQVAEETGVEVVSDLRVTDLGASGSYIGMMRFTAKRIAAALGRGGAK